MKKKSVPVLKKCFFYHTKGCDPLIHKIKVLLKFPQLIYKKMLVFLSPCYVFSLLQSIFVFSLIFNMFLNALQKIQYEIKRRNFKRDFFSILTFVYFLSLKLRVRAVAMKGKRKITCMLEMYLSLSVTWITFLLIIYAS